jgi:hypothetical protein
VLGTSTASGTKTVDLEPPDPFTPIIASDTAFFSGKYFLVFGTTDQSSGMAYYEVLEVPSGSVVGNLAQWQRATSPYLLQDQSLSSDIYVRAVDRSGNFRIVELPATHPMAENILRSRGSIEWGILVVLLLVVFGSIIAFAWHKKR